MAMLTLVPPQFRTQWEVFTLRDDFTTQFLFPINVVTISQEMVDVLIGFKTFSPVRYETEDGDFEIGYGIGDPDDEQGYTEEQAYSEWIGYVRNQQRVLRAQIPVAKIPNTVFDALMSLYLDTGTWRTLQADEGIYDVADAVRNANWLLVADILMRGNVNPLLRKREAAVLRLGDYTVRKTRRQQRIQAIQNLRGRYISGLSTEFERRQAEFAYFRQLDGTFLPGMSQLRQRRVVRFART
jgi:hypothetical protein